MDAQISNPSMLFSVDGTPVKFFIQKDIPDDLRVDLEDAIRAEGGSIEPKVPIRGYIVFQPDTLEAQRLIETWRTEERPQRYFVPYSWVTACKEKEQLLQQVFVDNARSVKIHIHRSIANINTRGDLTDTIKLHGGDPDVSREDATVILASSAVPEFRELRKEFQGREDKFVEDITWLRTCIDQNFYYHSPNPVRNPGGRRAGDERIPFTDDDEAHLCNWIATVIPHKESGGRTGNKIYKELEAKAGLPGFEWVGRHTWQSWRERYKKHFNRLDKHVAAIVSVSQANVPPRPESQYGLFKLSNGENSAPRKRRRVVSDQEKGKTSSGARPIELTSAEIQGTQNAEWAIRVGTNPVPDWAKQESDEKMNAGRENQPEACAPTLRTFVLTPATQSGSRAGPSFGANPEFAQDFGAQNTLLDQEILAVAQELQFLPTEIRAYYDRTGDFVATRQRFERFRALINSTP